MNATAEKEPVNPINLIPPPQELRIIISRRYAEISVLRRLLKAAETKSRLCPSQPEAAHAAAR